MDRNVKVKRASGQRSKKRKFSGNKFTRIKKSVGERCLNESASGKKIDLECQNYENQDEDFKGYAFVDVSLLFSNFEKYLSCKRCGSNVTLKQDVVCGLSCKFSIECKKCIQMFTFRNSKMLGSKKNIPEINRRFTYAFRTIGMGHSAMKTFCGTMDLPEPISAKSYNRIIKKLLSSSSTVAKDAMKCAAQEEITLTGTSDIIVSGDGSWKTRGHTSRVGLCAVIGDKSGKVLDIEVLSSYCKACDVWKSKKGTTEYNTWKKLHEDECLINHTGSAGKMEVVGMVRIFQRSEFLHNAKYVGYIGDGDAKTFQAITESKAYDPETVVEKIECVGHIQKRMGTRLRKLKQNNFKCSDGKSVGGKGRLTDKVIDKLTMYYGNAIREHKNNLLEMRRAVWAIYFHTRSTDGEPLHNFCPAGLDTWCCYQKSLAEGTSFTHKLTLPSSVMDAIKPIFNDLSQPKLLQRCLGGKTQNSNESLNSLIWKLCPKTQGSGKRIAEFAANEAVLLFNEGNISRLKIMEKFGLTVGSRAKKCMLQMDKRRIATAEVRLFQNTKEMRKHKRIVQKTLNEKLVLKEGPMYAAGEF